MSISTIRNATEKKGCQILLVVIGLALALGMVAQYAFPGQQPGQEGDTSAVAFVIDGTNYTGAQILAAADEAAQSQQFLDRSTPVGEFQAVGLGLQQLVASTILRQMAAEQGITLTDDKLLESLRTQIESQVEQLKLQLQLTGNVKPENLEAEFTKQVGKSSQQIITDQMTQWEEDIKVPAQRARLETGALASAVAESFTSRANITEEELKNSYDTFTFEQVAFETAASNTPEVVEKAEQARAELVAGTSPKAVRDKYNKGSTYETTDLSRQSLNTTEAFKPLLDLKVGEVSEVLYPYGFPIVYKLTKIENKLPENFEATKAQLLQQRKQALGQQNFIAEVQKRRDALKIDWKDRAFEMVYRATNLLSDPDLKANPTEFKAGLNDLRDDIDAAAEQTQNTTYLALARYAVLEELYSLGAAAEKEDLLDPWLETLNEVLASAESIDLRIAAAQRLLEAKRGEDAAGMLLDAATYNGDYDEIGLSRYNEINRMATEAKTNGLITEERAADIDAALKQWAEDKARYEDEIAQQAEEQKKLQEELDRDNLTSTTGATTGSTTGATTGSTPAPATTGTTTNGSAATTGTTGN